MISNFIKNRKLAFFATALLILSVLFLTAAIYGVNRSLDISLVRMSLAMGALLSISCLGLMIGTSQARRGSRKIFRVVCVLMSIVLVALTLILYRLSFVSWGDV